MTTEPSGPRLVRSAVQRVIGRAAIFLALGAILADASGVMAASPSPAPESSSAPGPFPNIEAWLDADFVTPDAPAGGELQAGITFWDTQVERLAPINGLYALMRPAKGDADPSIGTVTGDFTGHIVVEFVVPEGGPGPIEVGVQGRVCLSDGTCTDQNLPYAFAGTGPPPDAPPEVLLRGEIRPFVGDLVAGRPFLVSVDVVGRGQWQYDALPLPDRLVVTASERGGPDLASAELLRPGALGTPYTGHLTVEAPGDIALTVLLPGSDGQDQPIVDAAMLVSVLGEGPAATADPEAPGEAAPAGEIPLIVWVAGIGGLLAAGILVARRVFADL